MDFERRYDSIEEVLDVAKSAEGKLVKEYDVTNRLETKKNKGGIGQIIEEGLFHMAPNSRAEAFLSEQLLPVLREDMSKILGKEASFYIFPEDPQTICFQYPKVFEDSSTMQIIRLEIGALAAWTPSVAKTIAPYVAETYPNIFSQYF